MSTGVSDMDVPYLANKSRASYAFQQQGPNATLEFNWDHRIVGVTNDEAYAYAFAEFTPNTDMHYELSGAYSINGVAASTQVTQLYGGVDPLDVSSSKESRSTPDETLVVGSPLGGDYVNNVYGSFTGELKAGQIYSLFSIWYIHSYEDAAPSTATGSLRLELSPLNSAVVPEPSSLLLLGIGACGLLLRNPKVFRL